MGKLFVGGISYATDEASLRKHFEHYGEVLDAVVLNDRSTGKPRGFGFIHFADPQLAMQVACGALPTGGRVVGAMRL
jgi:RNA-binding protein Musashi